MVINLSLARSFQWAVLSLLLSLGGCWSPLRDDDPTPLGSDMIIDNAFNRTLDQGMKGRVERNRRLQQQKNSDQPVMTHPQTPGSGVVSEIRLGAAADGRRMGAAASGGDGTEGGQEELVPVELDFDQAELRDIIRVLFEQYLQQPYTILSDFKDRKVNFYYRSKSSRRELLRVLEAFLDFQGVKLVKSNGIYAIGDRNAAVKGQPAGGGIGNSAAAFKLHYLAATEFLIIARQFLDDPKDALVMSGSNVVFVHASGPQMRAVQELYDELDTPYFKGKYLLVYRPHHLTPTVLKALVDQYEGMLGSAAKGPQKLYDSAVVKGVPLLLVVAADTRAHESLKRYLAEVDNIRYNERQVFRYMLTNQKAGEVLTTIRSLIEEIMSDGQLVKLVADKYSNSLFIVATPAEFAEIQRLIRVLDERPTAVHIDLTIAEVQLNDALKYGVQWYLHQTFGDTFVDAGLDFSQDLGGKGFQFGVIDLGNNQFAAFDLLATKTNFSILANPQVVVRNGSTANLLIGQEIAVEKATLETNTAGSSAQTEFERRDVALTLEVTPTIGAGSQIQLAINLEDSRFVGRDVNEQPIFAKRKIKTDLIAVDGQSLFIGGIIRGVTISDEDRVPLLGDLSYFGGLFRNSTDQMQRTELIMQVTPRLIIDEPGAELLHSALLNAMRARSEAMGPTADSNQWMLQGRVEPAGVAAAQGGHPQGSDLPKAEVTH